MAEVVAAFRLVDTILCGVKFRAGSVAWVVGLYITAAYSFTAATSFANLAIAPGFSGTLAGIRPADVPGFVLAEIAGALLASALIGWLVAPARK